MKDTIFSPRYRGTREKPSARPQKEQSAGQKGAQGQKSDPSWQDPRLAELPDADVIWRRLAAWLATEEAPEEGLLSGPSPSGAVDSANLGTYRESIVGV